MLAKERVYLILGPSRFSARPANPVQAVKNCCKIYRTETAKEDYLNFHSLRLRQTPYEVHTRPHRRGYAHLES